MARTELMSVVNNTNEMIVVDFLEDEGHDAKIDTTHSREFKWPPIPWCGSQADFKTKGLVIRFGGKTFGIWQWKSDDGSDKVRWSPEGNWLPATVSNQIPGYSDVGGRICIVVNADGVKAYAVDWIR